MFGGRQILSEPELGGCRPELGGFGDWDATLCVVDLTELQLSS